MDVIELSSLFPSPVITCVRVQISRLVVCVHSDLRSIYSFTFFFLWMGTSKNILFSFTKTISKDFWPTSCCRELFLTWKSYPHKQDQFPESCWGSMISVRRSKQFCFVMYSWHLPWKEWMQSPVLQAMKSVTDTFCCCHNPWTRFWCLDQKVMKYNKRCKKLL